MPLFNRAKKRGDTSDNGQDQNGERKKEKGGWRKPANTAFKQQRLKAWQPILTPKTVLPTLFIIGIIFAPIGGLLVWGSSLVSEMTFDYTTCWNQTSATSPGTLAFTNMPYTYSLRSSDSDKTVPTPQFAYYRNDAAPEDQKHSCYIKFTIVSDLAAPVFQYYKLTNFYQNNRRYVQSLDTSQLQGDYVSPDTLSGSNCKPLGVDADGKAIYPCGLIANSVFNDTFSGFTPTINSPNNTNYTFTSSGIAWPGEAKKYSATSGYTNNLDQVVPPPNWVLRYPSYANGSIPNLQEDEHFQNWMRTAGLPTFTKLYGRNDTGTLLAGEYQVLVYMNYPVQGYKGTKSFVISTVSWIGGKNPFLGWAYVAASGVFVFLALAGTIRHLLKPRRLGDMSLLSWNR
ncbi:ligand-effect modulator 3 family [Suillus clintonianus]|uniref:ligand-effect modulator 3 family n=1 Tax=Suillus clintonianus TaxID=1904413 RepID=UPI001B8630CF|nr:ligand-effect modulator 3 family [Suillus clintonianus]KAG2115514.1 ligand-effect modulator 3 family [Suillus clintonianus]